MLQNNQTEDHQAVLQSNIQNHPWNKFQERANFKAGYLVCMDWQKKQK